MHRLTVALLAAVDAAIAVAVGIAATLAPFTLVWVFGFGAAADWGALWPASATVWQFGNLVPLTISLPADYLAAAGIDPDAASFVLSLSPLAFAAFTVIFAARSGVRASRADAWAIGAGVSAAVFTALAALVALSARNPVAATELWQAILVPALLFAVPCVTGAVVTEWSEAGAGTVAALRDRVEAHPVWGAVPALAARGAAVVVVGLIGLGALVTTTAVVLRGGEVLALFQATGADALGAAVIALGQLAYLPTLVVWGLAFAAGPGVVVGDGGVVSPSGTQTGVVPGIPALGILPDSTSPWLLLLALVPVALGAFAGWIARSRLVAREGAAGRAQEGELLGTRLALAAVIAVASGIAAALLSAAASGALGPGRLAQLGPQPGPVALAVGLEVLVGASILLLAPRGRERDAAAEGVAERGTTAPEVRDAATEGAGRAAAARPEPDTDLSPDLSPTIDLGPRKSGPDAPVD